jgi:uncharacterized protein (TIGR00255 family)
MDHIQKASTGVERHRTPFCRAMSRNCAPACRNWWAPKSTPNAFLQEAALLVDRSDIQEELVRLQTHIKHFVGHWTKRAKSAKSRDFCSREMNREANTLLSKTSGLAGDALKITEMGLVMKSEIEKSREQVQNVE